MNLWYEFVQDKWRNLSVTAGGYGSREKARMALKKGRRVVHKLTAEPMDIDAKDMDNAHDTVIDEEPLAMTLGALPIEQSSDKSVARSVDLVQIFYQSYFLLSLQVTYVYGTPYSVLVNVFYMDVVLDRNRRSSLYIGVLLLVKPG